MKTKKKYKKSSREIKEIIIRFLINSNSEYIMISTIAKSINSNWLTTQRFLNELEREGLILQIKALMSDGNEKVVCVRLNYEPLRLFDKILHEKDLEVSSGAERFMDNWVERTINGIKEKRLNKSTGKMKC